MSQLPPSPPNPNFIEAPLVHLIDTDPSKLDPEGLRAYLDTLRQFRGNPATRKAATEQKKRGPGNTPKSGLDLGGLL